MLLSSGSWVSPKKIAGWRVTVIPPTLEVTDQTSKTESSLKTGENESHEKWDVWSP